MFQKISVNFGKFQFLRGSTMRKDSRALVVEHKGCAGRVGDLFALARVGLRHLRRLSAFGLRPAFAGRVLGGRNAE
jgi:hypothetical protein